MGRPPQPFALGDIGQQTQQPRGDCVTGFAVSSAKPASPRTSDIAEAFRATTQPPQAIASSTGSPNPSYKLGNTKTSAP